MSIKNEQNFTNLENQYYNLNLNQYKKCPILVPVQSYSKTNNDEYCKSDNYKEREKLQSWNKSFKASCFTTFNENNDDLKKRWKNENTLKTTNKSSTLSLHIEENIEGLKNQKFGSIKKRCFTDAFKSQNPFEFPRQQNGDQKNEPEIMQYSASQRLIGSSQPSLSQQIENNDEQPHMASGFGTEAGNGKFVQPQKPPGAGTTLPPFPVYADGKKLQKQLELTEEEKQFRQINDIPDFLPPIWPQKCKPKAEKEISLESSMKSLNIQKSKCVIYPIKAASSTNVQSSEKIVDCEIDDTKKLPPFSSWKPSSPDFILRNPNVLSIKNAVEKSNKIDATVYKNVQAGTSLAESNTELIEEAIIVEELGDFDVPVKEECTKPKTESYSNKKDDVMQFKTLKRIDFSPSLLPKLKDVAPLKPVNPQSLEIEMPEKTAPVSEPRQQTFFQSNTVLKKKPNSKLSRIRKNIRLSNASTSALPQTKPHFSTKPISTTVKSQMKSTSSSSLPVPPHHPVTGGKTIKMGPPVKRKYNKRCKPQTPPPSNESPQCELLADKGIKMVIRIPKSM
uniref:Uncharacterized protein n=1 Tax=Panagrolaimus sp. PS1159 TaxID=55785 RepID=A0AC35FQ51_9BILA